jgi:hypothetical protein
MKVLIPTLLFFITGGGIAYSINRFVKTLRRNKAQRLTEHAMWELDEESDGEFHNVYAVRNEGLPIEERVFIGGAFIRNSNFDAEIEEVRSQAIYKLAALNNQPQLKR